jgi:hypothetical protein
MDHEHRFDEDVTIGGHSIDRRCECGLTLSAAAVAGMEGNSLPGIARAGVVTYVPQSVVTGPIVDEVIEESFRRGR